MVAVLLAVAAALLYVDPAPVVPADPDRHAARPVLPTGLVGVPVRLADPAALAVVRPGDRVDLLALPVETGGAAATVAAGVLVLDALADPELPVLYLALTESEARRAAVAGPEVRFGVIVRAG